jgi:Ca-activated chloride channel family protein
VALTIADLAGVSHIYPPVRSAVYAGSDATFFGRYAQPGKATLSVRGQSAGGPLNETATVSLPDRDGRRPWVGRGWARLRIADLLEHIDLEGEKEEWVREIIALAKEFHLVTPYTSFIAASRALLRPRVIQPGDPVLRVKTAPGLDIRQVTAVFPFGLTQKLRYLPAEGLWETRFLAPTWMKDGRYRCLLVLTEADGRKTSEWKSFVIDSRPPRLRADLAARLAHAGEHLEITVRADADTRRIQARVGDGPAAEVLWDPVRRVSVGSLDVPHDQPTGRAIVVVTAEDMAHNVASLELPLDVIGGR